MEGITGILIYVGLAAAAFLALYAFWRWLQGREIVFEVAETGLKAGETILKLFDKDPNTENILEKCVRIANYVVPAVKQAYERLEETNPDLAHKKMKDEALELVDLVLQKEGIQVDEQTRWIADRAIEAVVFFLPKPDSVGDASVGERAEGAVRKLSLEAGPDGVVRPGGQG